MNLLLEKMPLLLLSVFVMLGVTGCGSSKVVFVPESKGLIRIGPNTKGKVYYWNGSSWELSASKVLIPEGWYAGSMDVEVEEDFQPIAMDN